MSLPATDPRCLFLAGHTRLLAQRVKYLGFPAQANLLWAAAPLVPAVSAELLAALAPPLRQFLVVAVNRLDRVDFLAEREPKRDRRSPAANLGYSWTEHAGVPFPVTTGRRTLPAPVDQEREEGA